MALDRPDPDVLRQQLRPGLFEEWLEYGRYEPFGERSVQLQLAFGFAQLANVLGHARTDERGSVLPYTLDDFLLVPVSPVDVTDAETAQQAPPRRLDEPMSPEATKNYVGSIMAAMGARVPSDYWAAEDDA